MRNKFAKNAHSFTNALFAQVVSCLIILVLSFQLGLSIDGALTLV